MILNIVSIWLMKMLELAIYLTIFIILLTYVLPSLKIGAESLIYDNFINVDDYSINWSMLRINNLKVILKFSNNMRLCYM